MKKYAVLTFDEPEFESSYVNTPNEGKGGFCRLFFTGILLFSDVSIKVYKHRDFIKASVYFIFQLYYAIKSKIIKTETIFEFLSRHKIKGTFFGVFDLIDINEDQDNQLRTFKKIIDNGHELGLHGYKHLPLTESDIDKSISLAKEKLGVSLKTYSSPWGDDRCETVKLLKKYRFRGFRVWSMNENTDSDLVQLKYRNDLNGCTLNENYIILNIHGPDMYPIGKRKIEGMISELISNGYEFIRFDDLIERI